MMNRRDLLQTLSAGFGFTAFSGLSTREALAAAANPLAPKAPHFPARAKRVIFMYMQGAPSQHETFDYNPELASASLGNIMKPAFPFVASGQSGLMVSSLFPELAKQADELCLLNGLYADSPAHPQATIQMHTGSFTFVRPSMGAWVVYGLGTENQDLPGFITINPAGQGASQNYGSAFLPASYQGTPYYTRTGKLPNIANPEMKADVQRQQLDLQQQQLTQLQHQVYHLQQLQLLQEQRAVDLVELLTRVAAAAGL